ncbi:RNA-binding protein P-like [Malus sylvestris]|uniref:RNA-binding protein P-like n=1 Tax=Malus sylvestris TaxID=3752 RepID=UPI0021AD48F4|nr:RNA-binding protein P-like [Malus sylvestris]
MFTFAVAIEIILSDDIESQFVDECKQRQDWPNWKDSIQAELNSLERRSFFGLVVQTAPGVNPVGYKWEQLINVITEGTAKDSLSLTAFTTCEALVAGFQPFVEIEDYNLVLDKATSKPKGYGFVQFKTCCGAIKALKNPKKNVGNRIASCQLASVSSATNTATTTTSSSALSNSGSRKVYVNSVPHDVDGEKLRAFIKKFGEIETGPVGLDSQTRKSRDYALFIYKTLKGTKKALEKPFKVFEGY